MTTARWTLIVAVAAVIASSSLALGQADAEAPIRPAATSPTSASADPNAPALDAAHRAKAKALMDAGVKYLLAQREEDGAWSLGRQGLKPAITAMVVKALVQHPDYGPKHADVKKGFEVILKYRQTDGGVYNPQEGSSSYVGAVVLMALSAANLPEHAQIRQDLVKYLKGLQIVPGSETADGGKVGEDDPQSGGVGYGPRGGRGDLSVTGMWMQALQEAGVEPNDPAMQRAAAFVTRLQNFSEANNPMEWTKKAPDGGFVYVIPGSSGRGGPQEPRSYGSMTYTGFKSLLYAGVDRKDPRVQAAFGWIRKFWQIDGNPNMPAGQAQAGLFYYYHVFAKALAAWGEPVIIDAKGGRHNWRHELIDQLASIAKADGSWVNTADRWQESSPVLTTVFALLAIEETLQGTTAPAVRPDGR